MDGSGIALLLLGLLPLIGLPVINRRRRQRAEKSLKTNNGTLKQRIVEINERLRANEDRYHSLFSSMTEGLALPQSISGPDGTPVDYRFREINPAFEQATGQTAKHEE